jgi:hypothetical protein
MVTSERGYENLLRAEVIRGRQIELKSPRLQHAENGIPNGCFYFPIAIRKYAPGAVLLVRSWSRFEGLDCG